MTELQTKMSIQLWFILHGMRVKAGMHPNERINYYKSQKEALLRFGLTIKK